MADERSVFYVLNEFKSGEIIKECDRNKTELLIYDFEKSVDDFGEHGRREISDSFVFNGVRRK